MKIRTVGQKLMNFGTSLGHKINQAEDTIGGCTLYMHRPHANPDGCTDPAVCQTIDLPRVSAADFVAAWTLRVSIGCRGVGKRRRSARRPRS